MPLFLYTLALRDFLRPRRIVVWILVALSLLALGLIWRSVYTGTPREDYASLSSIFVFRLIALSSAIFATAIITQEVEQKTIVYLLTRPIPRWQLLVSRMLAAATVVFGVTVLAILATSIAIYGFRFGSNPLLFNDLKAAAVGSLAYVSLFTMFTLVINRAMVVCLIYAFLWEVGIPNFSGDLFYTSIFSYLQAIAEHPALPTQQMLVSALAGQGGDAALVASTAWPVLLILIGSLTGLAMWWFTHFEYVPREDAE